MRIRWGSGVVTAILLAAGVPTAAAQWAPATSCDRYGGGELQACLARALPGADAALNDAWRKALASVGNNASLNAADRAAWRDNLLASQRAWLAFRDANCKFGLIAAEWSNGGGATPAQQACVLSLTLQRANELTRRYTPN
ncbi:hypothetical protein GCM10019059_17980 [Camelimonas fluminis]|uniref:Lysozyme inhibitor LprI family protein n=1 Tax=Camelimonas fluminis TaxID=1576911 RepID=A0ABV7UJD1_9HYPH|nr:lysozyme inhibitor LprI family protein [Camelimonas fluminis]GHE58871.1 hypothetical protein GCM10019059_17980 [Camelimonas fluminis]